jgi:GxxExxY protein
MIAAVVQGYHKRKVTMVELLYKDEVYTIIGAAIEVHRVLGSGFLEGVYQEALEIELSTRQVLFDPQTPLNIMYKSHPLQKGYRRFLLLWENYR